MPLPKDHSPKTVTISIIIILIILVGGFISAYYTQDSSYVCRSSNFIILVGLFLTFLDKDSMAPDLLGTYQAAKNDTKHVDYTKSINNQLKSFHFLILAFATILSAAGDILFELSPFYN